MIDLVFSELDFDYELKALANSFFPGQKSRAVLAGDGCGTEYWRHQPPKGYSQSDSQESAYMPVRQNRFSPKEYTQKGCQERILARIFLGREKIQITLVCQDYWCQKEAEVSGSGDWHKHTDKSAHPYRTYYKNELKRLLFFMLRDLPEEALPAGIRKQVPDWGTMTGVRPTKIPMNELLQGKSAEQARQSLAKWYCCTPEKQELCLDIAVREAELLRDVDFQEGYSLYVGIPFCPTTCLYCSFPSYPQEQFGYLADAYLEALEKEAANIAKQCGSRKLTSIYIGGGTPTALTAGQLDKLLGFLNNYFPAGDGCEFTVEAGRPDSITKEKLEVLGKYPVGRISVNPQTMQQKTLDRIGREHTAADTASAFAMARELGFSNINMDLIIGLPGETAGDFADTLRQIKEFSPDSITIHSLVVKRASRLRSVLEETGSLTAEGLSREHQTEQMLARSRQFAKAEGYQPYYMYRQKNSAGHFGSSGQENIGYAKEGKACLYNILMMEEMQTIIGLGAGASTKVYHPDQKIVSRVENVKNITGYISRIDEMIARKKGIFTQF